MTAAKKLYLASPYTSPDPAVRNARVELASAISACLMERVPQDAADYIDLIYLWPDGTWCREEDLEEYLGFMSDDFEVHRVLDYDEHDNPCYTEKLSKQRP